MTETGFKIHKDHIHEITYSPSSLKTKRGIINNIETEIKTASIELGDLDNGQRAVIKIIMPEEIYKEFPQSKTYVWTKLPQTVQRQESSDKNDFSKTLSRTKSNNLNRTKATRNSFSKSIEYSQDSLEVENELRLIHEVTENEMNNNQNNEMNKNPNELYFDYSMETKFSPSTRVLYFVLHALKYVENGVKTVETIQFIKRRITNTELIPFQLELVFRVRQDIFTIQCTDDELILPKKEVRFDDDHRIGNKGAQGCCYLAKYQNENVVVKMYYSEVGKIESKIMKEMRHKNIVDILAQFYDVDNSFNIIMPKAVSSYKEMYERLSDKQNAKLLIDCIHGIDYLHKKNIIHLDIKLENVLIFKQIGETKSGYVAKLGDFGTAQDLGFEECITIEGNPLGTSLYMDPEIYRKKCYSRESDIFSLGRMIEFVFGKYDMVKLKREGDIMTEELSRGRKDFPFQLIRDENINQIAKIIVKDCCQYERKDRTIKTYEIIEYLHQLINMIDEREIGFDLSKYHFAVNNFDIFESIRRITTDFTNAKFISDKFLYLKIVAQSEKAHEILNINDFRQQLRKCNQSKKKRGGEMEYIDGMYLYNQSRAIQKELDKYKEEKEKDKLHRNTKSTTDESMTSLQQKEMKEMLKKDRNVDISRVTGCGQQNQMSIKTPDLIEKTIQMETIKKHQIRSEETQRISLGNENKIVDENEKMRKVEMMYELRKQAINNFIVSANAENIDACYALITHLKDLLNQQKEHKNVYIEMEYKQSLNTISSILEQHNNPLMKYIPKFQATKEEENNDNFGALKAGFGKATTRTDSHPYSIHEDEIFVIFNTLSNFSLTAKLEVARMKLFGRGTKIDVVGALDLLTDCEVVAKASQLHDLSELKDLIRLFKPSTKESDIKSIINQKRMIRNQKGEIEKKIENNRKVNKGVLMLLNKYQIDEDDDSEEEGEIKEIKETRNSILKQMEEANDIGKLNYFIYSLEDKTDNKLKAREQYEVVKNIIDFIKRKELHQAIETIVEMIERKDMVLLKMILYATIDVFKIQNIDIKTITNTQLLMFYLMKGCYMINHKCIEKMSQLILNGKTKEHAQLVEILINPLYRERKQNAIFIKAQCDEIQGRRDRCIVELKQLTLQYNNKAFTFIMEVFNRKIEQKKNEIMNISDEKMSQEEKEKQCNESECTIREEMNSLIRQAGKLNEQTANEMKEIKNKKFISDNLPIVVEYRDKLRELLNETKMKNEKNKWKERLNKVVKEKNLEEMKQIYMEIKDINYGDEMFQLILLELGLEFVEINEESLHGCKVRSEPKMHFDFISIFSNYLIEKEILTVDECIIAILALKICGKLGSEEANELMMIYSMNERIDSILHESEEIRQDLFTTQQF